MADVIRETSQRRSDALGRLEGDADVWIATAGSGEPYLVPLSLAWDGVTVVLATPARSRTARNVVATGRARLALGTTRDVVLIEADVDAVPCAIADAAIAECYVSRTGWDPRQEGTDHVYLLATPQVIRAWRNVAEIDGRTIMRGGRWTS